METEPNAQHRDGFSLEFREGLIQPSRSRILGDVGENDPINWHWGGPNGVRSADNIHSICFTFAQHPEDRPNANGTRPVMTAAGQLTARTGTINRPQIDRTM